MLKIKNISKKYKNKNVLKNINLTINSGEIISLLGINGAGKSTLSHILTGIKQPTGGDIFYQEESIYKNISSYKKKIGLCQQTPNLDSMITLRENLYFAGKFFCMEDKEINHQIEKISSLLKLDEYLDSYDFLLSGGFKQRFMIARSIIHNPEYIILDEPTVAIDPQMRRELWRVIKKIKNSGIGIVLTTHYLDEAEFLSDRVCILHNGKIKVTDTVKNIIEQFKTKNLEDAFISFLDKEDIKELTKEN